MAAESLIDAEALTARITGSLELLEAIAADRGVLADLPDEMRVRLLIAAGWVSKPMRLDNKRLWDVRRSKERDVLSARRAADQRQLDRTGIRRQRLRMVYATPRPGTGTFVEPPAPQAEPIELLEPQPCYVCKYPYRQVHPFYDALCPACAELNWR